MTAAARSGKSFYFSSEKEPPAKGNKSLPPTSDSFPLQQQKVRFSKEKKAIISKKRQSSMMTVFFYLLFCYIPKIPSAIIENSSSPRVSPLTVGVIPQAARSSESLSFGI